MPKLPFAAEPQRKAKDQNQALIQINEYGCRHQSRAVGKMERKLQHRVDSNQGFSCIILAFFRLLGWQRGMPNMVDSTTRMVRVWDPLVRVGHWVLVVAFFVAYLTEDDLLGTHVWAGYVAGTIVVLRVVWGVAGPLHARFSDFVCGPIKVFSYLRDLLLFRAPRYLGHSPAGGAMVLALLLSLAATVGTGLLAYGADQHAGPLAPLFASQGGLGVTRPALAAADGAREVGVNGGREGRGREEQGGAFKEIHEFFANLTLVLIVLHIAGVGLASVVHRENLVRAMITGDKRPNP